MRTAAQLFTALLILAPAVVAQQAPSEGRQNPAVVSAEALKYGAELTEHADEELLEWAGKYVAKELRWNPPQIKETFTAVDQAFTSESEDRRAAIAYLVFYLAYHDQREQADAFSRQLERDTAEVQRIRRDVDLWVQHGFPPASVAARPPSTVNMQREIERLSVRIRQLQEAARLHTGQLAAIRGRVDYYLRLLRAARPSMGRVPPEILDHVPANAAPDTQR